MHTNVVYLNVKGAAFTCKACPSLETVETVSKFTLCETLKGFMQGFAPHPTRGSASGLCQRVSKPFGNPFLFILFFFGKNTLQVITPLETRFYSFKFMRNPTFNTQGRTASCKIKRHKKEDSKRNSWYNVSDKTNTTKGESQ